MCFKPVKGYTNMLPLMDDVAIGNEARPCQGGDPCRYAAGSFVLMAILGRTSSM